MNDTIRAFYKRRKKRLDDNIQWISTEEGVHIPLENGKSVGGWSKGKEFSNAKSVTSTPKKEGTPTQKLSHRLRKAKTMTEYQDALISAKRGAKVFIQEGDTVTGYEKSGDGMHALWIPYSGNKSERGIDSYLLGIHAKYAKYAGTTAKEARKRTNENFPTRSEYGMRQSISSSGRNGEKGVAEYYKGLSGKKELYEAAAQPRNKYKVNNAFEEFCKSNKLGDPEEYSFDPKKRTMTVTFAESKGKGKKKERRTEVYDVHLTGGKYSVVGSDGKVAPNGAGKPDITYKISATFRKRGG